MSATSTTLQTLSDSLAALVDRAAKFVAGVHGGTRRGASGLIWQDGIVVTADEALRHEADLRLALPEGGIAPATLTGRDPTTDIAILHAAELHASVPPPSTAAQVGALVLAVGRRNGSPVARLGIIAEVGDPWRSMRGGQIDRFIRLDLRLDQAMEGGAVIDAAGALLGMVVFGPRGRALVIPSQTIARIVPRLVAGGSLARGYLGLGLHRVPAGQPAGGVIVVAVDPDGPGAAAGILLGDVITTWGGQPISGMRDVMRRLGPDSAGTDVELGLVRAGAPTKVTLHVGQRPAS